MNQHATPIQIFIAYSRKDGDYIDKIRIALNPLERQRSVKIWYDGEPLYRAKLGTRR